MSLDRDMLTHLVRRALDRPSADLVTWQYEPVDAGRGPATAGLYRLAGTTQDDGQQQTWSLILKIVSPVPPASEDMTHPLYWRREALAFSSGLLENLPGDLRAVHCYAVVDQPDGSCWLWLEDAQEGYGYAWPVQGYRRAAHALGQLNGAYLAGRTLPDHPWLVQDTSPRGVLNAYTWLRDLAADPAVWRDPQVAGAFPASLAGRLLRLWDEREALLSVVEAMPFTLCHADAWRGNLFLPPPASADQRVVAIDWAYVGHGRLGTDAGDLLAPGFGHFAAQTDSLPVLEQAIFAGYLSGLHWSGWHGDPARVRQAYIAFAAAKYGCLQVWLTALQDESARAGWAAASGRPFEEFVRRQALMLSELLELLAEVGLGL